MATRGVFCNADNVLGKAFIKIRTSVMNIMSEMNNTAAKEGNSMVWVHLLISQS